MKKIIITIGMVLFLATIVDSFVNASSRGRAKRVSVRRRGRRYPQRRSPMQSRTLAQKSAAQKKTATPTTTKTSTTATAATQVAQSVKTIEEKTQELDQAEEKVKAAATPAAKQEAIKTVQQKAQDLINSMKVIDRSYKGDLRGYEEKDIKLAQDQIKQLEEEQKAIKKEIDAKQNALADVSEPGTIWNLWRVSPKKDQEAAYNKLNAEISSLNSTWGGLEKRIQENKVITGDVWSNASKSLAGAGALMVAAGVGDIALTGGSNLATIASSAGVGLEKAKDMGLGVANVAGAGLEKVSSYTPNFVKSGGSMAFSFGKSMGKQMLFSIVMGKIIGVGWSLYNKYLADPNATPKQVNNAKKEVEFLEGYEKLKAQYKALKNNKELASKPENVERLAKMEKAIIAAKPKAKQIRDKFLQLLKTESQKDKK